MNNIPNELYEEINKHLDVCKSHNFIKCNKCTYLLIDQTIKKKINILLIKNYFRIFKNNIKYKISAEIIQRMILEILDERLQLND